MTLDHDDSVELKFKVNWGTTKPFFMGGMFNCYNPLRMREKCPNVNTHLKIVNGSKGKTPTPDDYRHGSVIVKAGMFKPNTKWRIVIYSKMAHTCVMDLKIQPENI
jgi:hypothetical protein